LRGDHAQGNQPSTVLAEDALEKGFGMLIRGKTHGIPGEGANAASHPSIPAATLPTLLLGGLLPLIGP
jgi:hypothetical protein